MPKMMLGAPPRGGFSLIELLVVLLIFAILVAIAVPSIISSQPERNLAAAGDLVANDINYCRAKAQSTGNTVYFGFEFTPDDRQVEGWWDDTAAAPGAPADSPTRSGQSFINPANPGVGRTAKAYYIVEARPRTKADGSAFTYLDWCNAFDKWDSSDNDPPYPVEPLFPFSVTDTLTAGTLPDPSLEAFNAIAAPLVAYPQDMTSGSETVTYDNRFRVLPEDGYGMNGWGDGNANDQQFKVFCVADEQEILSYDQNVDRDGSGELTYDGIAGGITGGHSGSMGDHVRLKDQVVDYVLLKRVKLPDHVVFMNPWKNSWCVGWEGPQSNPVYEYQDMQFLQYIMAFHGSGEVNLADWSYDPEPFPNGSYAGLNHGSLVERSGMPVVRSLWMVIEECVDFTSPTAMPARASLIANRKSNQSGSGRMLSIWPLNGKYYVVDYTPNDGARKIDYNDPRLDLSYNYTGSDPETDEMPLVAREYGYSQNFLVP